MYSLPFYHCMIVVNTLFLHLTGRMRPIIFQGDASGFQSTFAYVLVFYLVVPGYMISHNSKFLTVSMLKKYYPNLTTCCSIVGPVYCCVTYFKANNMQNSEKMGG